MVFLWCRDKSEECRQGSRTPRITQWVSIQILYVAIVTGTSKPTSLQKVTRRHLLRKVKLSLMLTTLTTLRAHALRSSKSRTSPSLDSRTNLMSAITCPPKQLFISIKGTSHLIVTTWLRRLTKELTCILAEFLRSGAKAQEASTSLPHFPPTTRLPDLLSEEGLTTDKRIVANNLNSNEDRGNRPIYNNNHYQVLYILIN